MKHVLMRLQEFEKQATATEKNVIRYFLEQTEEAGELSIYEIAEKTYSSPSTVIRLCKKIGFQGYKDFRKSLLYETAVRKESAMKHMEEIRQEDSLEEIVNKVTIKNIMSLENTQKLVDLRYDCDGDTLLALVNPAGPACHTGARTCFYRSMTEE